MYTEFFGLREKPFTLTPNPRYAFHSEHYGSALEHLLYGIREREGFLLLSGAVGTGKTTLCRDLLQCLDGAGYRTALIFNPFLEGEQLLHTLLDEFGCSYREGEGQKELLDRLNRFLLAQLIEGVTCVAIFDEAQLLSDEVLERIRVVSNLETESEKLIQIVLVGQPELVERIESPTLAQLDQRISVRCTLQQLGRAESERYLYHRLNVAGSSGGVTFTASAVDRVHAASGGLPRRLNLIGDRALLAAYVAQERRIDRKQVEAGLAALAGEDQVQGHAETEGQQPGNVRRLPIRIRVLLPLTAFLLLAIALTAWYLTAASTLP